MTALIACGGAACAADGGAIAVVGGISLWSRGLLALRKSNGVEVIAADGRTCSSFGADVKQRRRETGMGTMMATFLVVHLVCCGGAALLLGVGGSGLLGLGVMRGSVLVLAVGLVAVIVGAYWRAHRR